jgi:hypothetical protein
MIFCSKKSGAIAIFLSHWFYRKVLQKYVWKRWYLDQYDEDEQGREGNYGNAARFLDKGEGPCKERTFGCGNHDQISYAGQKTWVSGKQTSGH